MTQTRDRKILARSSNTEKPALSEFDLLGAFREPGSRVEAVGGLIFVAMGFEPLRRPTVEEITRALERLERHMDG